jgi:hypothetical protein
MIDLTDEQMEVLDELGQEAVRQMTPPERLMTAIGIDWLRMMKPELNQPNPGGPQIHPDIWECDCCGSERHIDDTDCPDCRGTGIGYNHEPHSCGRCKGRGYLIGCPSCGDSDT